MVLLCVLFLGLRSTMVIVLYVEGYDTIAGVSTDRVYFLHLIWSLPESFHRPVPSSYPDLICRREIYLSVARQRNLTLHIMDNHQYAHIVATFMQKCFQFRLAKATGSDIEVVMPTAPLEIDALLHQACLFAVERCLCAFTNPSTFLFLQSLDR